MNPTHLLRFTLTTSALAASCAMAAPPGGMRPGLWETTLTSNMAGGKPISTRACVTAKQLEDPKGTLPKMDANMKCEPLDYKTSGSTVSWKMRCTGEVPMEGTGQMTAEEGAAAYDTDVIKQAQQLGIPGW